MTEGSVWIPTRDGKKLEGLLHRPSGPGPFPAAIFVHGLGMTMHEWNGSLDEIAGRLNDSGILTLQFQFDIFKPDPSERLGVGGSVRELPLDERAQQFEDALKWLLARPDVDTKRIGILAQSYGVPTVLSLAGLNPAVKSYVFVSGTYFPEKSIRRVYEERGVTVNFHGDTRLPRSSGEETTVGREFWPSLASFDPIKEVKKLTQPVLMIHGDQDTKVSTAEAKHVFTATSSKKKQLKIFKGGDHGITDVPRPMREEFLTDVVKWFKTTL